MKTVILACVLACCGLPTLTFAYNAYADMPPPCFHPGQCHLFYELIPCDKDGFTCKDGTRRVWSYRPLYYPVDHSKELQNLDTKLCPKTGRCYWPYSLDQVYN